MGTILVENENWWEITKVLGWFSREDLVVF
jgi:hypothetical protein